MRRLRLLLVLLIAVAVAGGCAGSGSPPPARPAGPVAVELEAEPARAGPPDAGTAAGHGARAAARWTTRSERFVLRGSVEPAGSEVRLLDGATREQSAIARRSGPRFAFTLEHLEPGTNRYVIEATHRGRPSWRRPVRIVRRAPRIPVPRSVVVPRDDPSPAQAELRLDRRRLRAVAIGRDTAGMARIRVSAELRLRCRTEDGGVDEVGLVRHDPPSQIGHVRVVPGTRVPAELRRRTDLRSAARTRCREAGGVLAGAAGVVWAEATNAHGRDRYSADVAVAVAGG